MAQIDRVVVSMPGVKRLGALLNLTPFIYGLCQRFGRKVIIAANPHATELWRHMPVNNAEVVNACQSAGYEMIKARCCGVRPGNIVGLTIEDDMFNCERSYEFLHRTTPPDSFRIGFDDFFYSITKEFDGELWTKYIDCSPREDHFDLEISSRGYQRPHFLNQYLGLLALPELNPNNDAILDGIGRRPMIWTGLQEKEFALKYFEKRGWDKRSTVGMHITAANRFNDWDDGYFMDVANALIGSGRNLLLVCGWLAPYVPLPEFYSKSTDRFHRKHVYFLSKLKRSYGPFRENAVALAFSDAVRTAELIRLCGCFVSKDTGPAHLAAAVGTPKITISSNNPTWVIEGPNDLVLRLGKDAGGSVLPKPVQVIEAIDRLLM